jgi:hypothetical protein
MTRAADRAEPTTSFQSPGLRIYVDDAGGDRRLLSQGRRTEDQHPNRPGPNTRPTIAHADVRTSYISHTAPEYWSVRGDCARSRDPAEHDLAPARSGHASLGCSGKHPECWIPSTGSRPSVLADRDGQAVELASGESIRDVEAMLGRLQPSATSGCVAAIADRNSHARRASGAGSNQN